MYCRHVALTNFRNYSRLELDLSSHLSLFWGDNGQGKSNLLEAVYLLATARSYRTAAERELVNWHAGAEPVFARALAEVVRQQSTSKLELILAEPRGASAGLADATAPEDAPGGVPGAGSAASKDGQPPAASIRRRVRINGRNVPLIDLIGHLNVVLFSPEDVDLIAGPAEVRRRYLNRTLCQVDQRYLRTLLRYERVRLQRNALLRQLRDRPPRANQFDYWNAQLIELGAVLIVARLRAVAFLNRQLAEIHPRLVSGPDSLRAEYRSTVPLGEDTTGHVTRDTLETPHPLDASEGRPSGADEEAALAYIQERFVAQLAVVWPRERQQAITLVGPHRDDAAFSTGDVDLRVYGSRGQQRTAALSLKLAEVTLMQEYTSERPVLLLDDVMSELDPQRRRYLQSVVLEQEQALLTATDLAFFSPEFLSQTNLYQVEAGAVRRAP